MTELLERLERATGPDRELDAEIMFDLYAKPVGKSPIDGGPTGYLWPEDNASWSFGIRFPGKDRAWFADPKLRRDGKETLLIERDGALILMNNLRIPPLTASIDAALSLREPGSEYEITTLYGVARVGINLNHGDDSSPFYGEHLGGSVPIALCIAALKARATSRDPAGTEEK